MMTSRKTASYWPVCASIWGRSGWGVLEDMRLAILGRRRVGDEGGGEASPRERRGVSAEE
jgi:hypothetical protein